MRRLLPFLSLIIIASCGTKNSAENTQGEVFNFTYEIDTVVVDASEHFFFLNWDLKLAAVSPDRKYLYNLNPDTYLLEMVNLDSLKLEKTVQLEKEGPDGIGGEYYQKIQVLENSNICLFGQFKINIVSEQGKLVNTIELDQIKIQNHDQKAEEKIGWEGVLSPDGKLFASTLVNVDFKKPARGFVLIDLETDSITYIPLDLFAKLKGFEIVHQEGNAPGIATGETAFLSFMDDNLMISSSAYNEVYRYNWNTDSLSHHSFEATLTDNEKVINYSNQVSSSREWDDAEKAKKEQVSFNEFLKIPNQPIFWRLSTDKDRMIGDSVTFRHITTLFDSDLNLLKEQELEDYHFFRRPFFKDHMLYSFLNIDDEMAFVRLKPTFNSQ